jgi:hypothetical protein
MRTKTVSLKPYNSPVFFNDSVFKINNGHNAFWNLDKVLSKKNITIHTSDLIQNADYYIYADVPYPWRFDQWVSLLRQPKRKKILFCFESPLVNPFNHILVFLRLFGTVYTWNDTLASNSVGIKKLYIPQLPHSVMKHKPFSVKKEFVCVNAKKSALWIFTLISPFKRNLYLERRRIIQFFNDQYADRFDLFGRGWREAGKFSLRERIFGTPTLSVYRGEIKELEKIPVLSNYKFCICFENASAPGYITEKIFDCFLAGVVPIYLGAPNISTYIPKETYISMEDFASYEELIEYTKSMTETRYTRYITAASAFLKDQEKIQKWSVSNFQNNIVSLIQS